MPLPPALRPTLYQGDITGFQPSLSVGAIIAMMN
jgi:hypothetical protein